MMKYKNCYVPNCPNSTVSAPDKVFLPVPTNLKERERWMAAVERTIEDTAVSPKTKLFCCEDHFDLERDMLSWRKFKFLREGGLRTQALLRPGVLPHIFPHPLPQEIEFPMDVVKTEISDPDSDVEESVVIKDEPLDSPPIKEEPPDMDYEIEMPKPMREKCDKGVQVTCQFNSCSAGVQADLDQGVDSSCQTVDSPDDSDKPWSWDVPCELDSCEKALNKTMRRIKRNPTLHIGVSPRNMGFINRISVSSACSPGNVFLTLNKLAVNLDFETLGENFGLSPSQAVSIFKDTVTKLAEKMKEFIAWPNRLKSRKLALPHNAVTMIKVLEVKIEKPSKRRLHALTKSKTWRVNTCKYLVSCSADGTFNFVSRGYCGRASDSNMAVDSGWVSHVPERRCVMPLGDFEALRPALRERQVRLVTVPEIPCKVRPSRQELYAARTAVRLLWNADRITSRLRNFSFFSLSSFVEEDLVPFLDSAVVVALGFLNQDDPLIV